MDEIISGHPEDTCECCGRDNVIWSAPNDLWNAVARREDGTDPMLCPNCFIWLANKTDQKVWRIHPVETKQMTTETPKIEPTYYVLHPNGVYSAADPQPGDEVKAALAREIAVRVENEPLANESERLRNENAALREAIAEGEAGIRRRLLGETKAVPTFMVDGTIPRALQALLQRIERCGASVDLTAASSLCADLLRAAGGDTYAMTRVDAALNHATAQESEGCENCGGTGIGGADYYPSVYPDVPPESVQYPCEDCDGTGKAVRVKEGTK